MSFFQLGSNLGYGHHPTPIDYQGNILRPSYSKVLPLDPIDKAVVGRVRVTKLRQFARDRQLANLSQYLDLLGDDCTVPAWFVEGFDQKPHKATGFVGSKYRSHFTDLYDCGLLELSTREKIIMYHSKYFCVNKSDEHSRSIFNGELLSLLCPVPDPVNLADTRAVVEGFHAFFEGQRRNDGGRRCYAYLGDFRHWFHQISASEWMRQLFGLRQAGGFSFRWTSIPMGWSWSPLLAQSVAWSVLLSRAKDQKPILDEDAFRVQSSHNTGQLPTWVNVVSESGTVVGRATVYYDNFLFLIDNPCDLARVEARMAQNCGRLRGLDPDFTGEDSESTGAFCKAGSVESISNELFIDRGFDFLGVHFQGEQSAGLAALRQGNSSADPPRKLSRAESRRAGNVETLTWWPARTEAWRAVSSDVALRLERGDPTSLREAAQVAGQAVFAANMSLGGIHCAPLGDDLLAAAREIGRQAFSLQRKEITLRRDEAWDRPIVQGEWSKALARVWREASDPARCRYQTSLSGTSERPRRSYLHVLCTDASSHSIGWCELTRGHLGARFDIPPAKDHQCGGRPLTKEERQEHIFISEMRAALEGLHEWCEDHRCDTRRVTLVVDNSATAFALRHGFSSNVKATAMMRAHREDMARVEDVILVISEDNPSDCCSRNTAAEWAAGTGVHGRGHQQNEDQKKAFPDRMRDVVIAIEARMKGWNWASEKRTVWSKRAREAGGMRHVPPDDETFDTLADDFATIELGERDSGDESEDQK